MDCSQFDITNCEILIRLKAEERRLAEIGPIAYYSEWVSAYKDVDTSREAVQKRYEETGKDENEQLIEMFSHQTAEEYRIMAGRDRRINRDPLAMRMREDLIKESKKVVLVCLVNFCILCTT